MTKIQRTIECGMKIGLIGMSEGNGHPYSWSAIINGYDKDEMHKCPFPVIPEYLSKEICPYKKIENAKVSHIWTQDWETTQKIAKTCYVENPTKNLPELIKNVDAVILARDDSQNHYHYSREVINKGLPILVDKQLATNEIDAHRILDLETYQGQISSCSGLKYSKNMTMSAEEIKKLGKIRRIRGITPKSWEKYSVHLHQSLVNILGTRIDVKETERKEKSNSVSVIYHCTNLEIEMRAEGQNSKAEISLNIYGEYGEITLTFKDTYSSFSQMLTAFIESVKNKTVMVSREEMLTICRLIDRGMITNGQRH